MSNNYPKVEAVKTKEFTSKQSQYEIAGRLPIRSVILGPSGSGKTTLLVSKILDIYRGCFNRIYIFSPSVHVDFAWRPVIDHIEKDLKIDLEKEHCLFDHYDAKALQHIIDVQHKVSKYMKDKDYKKIYQVLVIIDDFADDPSFTRHSKLLHSLYIRGRHTYISTITATQVFNVLHPVIRKNITELYVYKLRNRKDLDSVIEEMSALTDKKTLLEIYNMATEKPYSFLYINLVAKSIQNMFYIKFEKRIEIEDN